MLKLCSGHEQDGEWIPGWNELEVHALREGDQIAPRETVMTIEGDYSLFAHLETVYLGSLARRSLIMRNVLQVVEAARGKQIFYFPARHDHWLVQTGDGWSAHVAGAIGVSTDAQASWWGGRGIGTVPHGLIAAYGGDTVKAATVFADRYHERDEHHRAGRLGQRLGADGDRGRASARTEAVGRAPGHQRGPRRPLAVRRDGRLQADRRQPRGWSRRSGARSTTPATRTCGSSPAAASPPSGSASSRPRGVPVDAYGVGSSLIRGDNDFTADVVRVDGRPCAKVGRRYSPNPRLERVE